jgi:hypothetical protein
MNRATLNSTESLAKCEARIQPFKRGGFIGAYLLRKSGARKIDTARYSVTGLSEISQFLPLKMEM